MLRIQIEILLMHLHTPYSRLFDMMNSVSNGLCFFLKENDNDEHTFTWVDCRIILRGQVSESIFEALSS